MQIPLFLERGVYDTTDRKPGAFGHFYMSDRKATDSGANLTLKVVIRKIHTFVAYLKKFEKFDYPPFFFLVGLIYRWGKGLKKQKLLKTVCFLNNMRKKKEIFFFTFF